MSEIKSFDGFPEAFDYCREKDQPVTVLVLGEKWRLYPSGNAKRLSASSEQSRRPGC